MRTLRESLLKLTARSIKDLIDRNRESSANAGYKIMCCTGTLSQDNFNKVEKIPENIPCSDTCRVLVINYRSKEKNPQRFQCAQCLREIEYNGHAPLIKKLEEESKTEVEVKPLTPKIKYSRKVVKQ